MENGSARPASDAHAAPNGHASGSGHASGNGSAPANGQLPLTARLLVAGARGARGIGRATGIDRAVEVAAEEAIVAAVESEAVERALARVLEGPAVEEAVEGALESDAVKRALLEAMDSELADEVWRRLLASDQAQQLVERIAEAPEVRAAISAQGAGLLQDIGRTIAKLSSRLDDAFEGIARRLFLRRRRVAPTDRAGAVSRALALAVDGFIVNLSFSALAALAALVVSALGGSADNIPNFAVVAGAAAWAGVGALYLFAFWALAGETPGMRFLGIRIAGGRLAPGRALKRLLGMALGVLTLGIGFLGIVFGERRRGIADRIAGTEVVYDDRRPAPAPWSRPAPAEPVPPAEVALPEETVPPRARADAAAS